MFRIIWWVIIIAIIIYFFHDFQNFFHAASKEIGDIVDSLMRLFHS